MIARSESLRLIPADEARRLLATVPPVGVETVDLSRAVGRVLATPLVADVDMPSELRSAMDGYAVQAADVATATEHAPVNLTIVGTVLAGTTFDGVLTSGQAVGIVTGGVVPSGGDAVVMVESTQAAPGKPGMVAIVKGVSAGAHVVQRGEDVPSGATVLSAGRRLRASDIAALASFGIVDVAVFRRPRIAVFATGSELCLPEQTPRPGQVRDSNSYVLAAEVEQAGGIAVRAGIVDDDLDRLRETVLRLAAENDGVILSGGSSIGPKDLTGAVLRALPGPGVVFHGIDIRPGKPTVFALAGAKPVIGMPGYPTSSMVVFEAFVRPMLARLGGEAVADDFPSPVRARLAKAYVKPASREDYLRVKLVMRDGEPTVDVLPGGSAAISNVLQADGLVRVPAGVERWDAGQWVAVRLF